MVMRRKCLQIFIVGILLGAMFLPFAYSEPVEAAYHGGSGTAMYPYEISKVEHLQNISEHLDAYWILWTDIDASATSGWNGGAGFDPIGTFTGSFDGNGYTISNLFIYRPATSNIGLFDFTDGAVIQNVAFTGINITGRGQVGGLIGYADDTLISNCHIEGDIVSDNDGQIGGIAGYTLGTTVISSCHTSGTVSAPNGDNYVGGIVGRNAGITTIINSYSTSLVTGKNYVGGIVGYSSGTCAITQCYTTGDVNATGFQIGGIIGYSFLDSMTDCYARGDVTGDDIIGGVGGGFYDGPISSTYSTGLVTAPTDFGGLVGGDGTALEVTPCFWDNQTSNQTVSAIGTGKTTAQMQTQSTFTGWNFYGIWAIDNITNDGYPYFGYGDAPPPIWPGPDYVPIYLLAIPISSSEIALIWGMGVNTTGTRIMGKTGGWPSTYNDPYATLVYEGDQTTVSHKGLDAGTTYYYRAWGVLGGGYSEDYAEDLATTLMGGGDNITVPVPPWWFQEPSCAAYENIPIFGLVESTAESYDMPCNTACLLITIFLLILISIIAFSITHNALASGLVLAVGIVIASIAGLLPMWMLLVALLMVVGISFAWSRA